MASVSYVIGRVVAGITGVRSKTDTGLVSSSRVRAVRVVRKTNGTGAGQANKVWTKTYSVADAATQNISLSGVADGLGDGLLIGSLSAVMLRTDATTGYFTITLPASLGGNTFKLLAGMTALFVVESTTSAGFWVSDPAFVAVNAVGATANLEITLVGVGS